MRASIHLSKILTNCSQMPGHANLPVLDSVKFVMKILLLVGFFLALVYTQTNDKTNKPSTSISTSAQNPPSAQKESIFSRIMSIFWNIIRYFQNLLSFSFLRFTWISYLFQIPLFFLSIIMWFFRSMEPIYSSIILLIGPFALKTIELIGYYISIPHIGRLYRDFVTEGYLEKVLEWNNFTEMLQHYQIDILFFLIGYILLVDAILSMFDVSLAEATTNLWKNLVQFTESFSIFVNLGGDPTPAGAQTILNSFLSRG